MLNSEFVNTLLKWGLSKVGLVAAAFVGWAFNQFNLAAYVTPEDAAELRTWITKGVTAALMLFIAFLIERQKRGVKVMQAVAVLSPDAPTPKVDGVAGNAAVKAVANAAGVPLADAIAVVK